MKTLALGLTTAIAIAFSLPTFSAAQYPPDLDVGQQIRLKTDDAEDWRTGDYLYGEIGHIHVRLGADAPAEVISLSEIDSLEVWAMTSNRGGHIATGALVGGIAGGILGAIARSNENERQEDSDALIKVEIGPGFVVLMALLGVGAGAGLGALIGESEGWRGVSLEAAKPTDVQVRLVPDPRHPGIALSLRF